MVTLNELDEAMRPPRIALPIGTDAAVNELVACAASAASFASRIARMDADEADKPAELDADMAAIEPDPVKWVRFLLDEACGP